MIFGDDLNKAYEISKNAFKEWREFLKQAEYLDDDSAIENTLSKLQVALKGTENLNGDLEFKNWNRYLYIADSISFISKRSNGKYSGPLKFAGDELLLDLAKGLAGDKSAIPTILAVISSPKLDFSDIGQLTIACDAVIKLKAKEGILMLKPLLKHPYKKSTINTLSGVYDTYPVRHHALRALVQFGYKFSKIDYLYTPGDVEILYEPDEYRAR